MGTLPQAFFFPIKIRPHISGSPELVGTLPQALFFSTKKGPIFLGTDPPDLGTDHEGTARKYLARHGIMRARHGNIWHGTDPPDLGTARHGTSLYNGKNGTSGERAAQKGSEATHSNFTCLDQRSTSFF